MSISRRAFLEVCRNSAVIGAAHLLQLEEALANPNAPTVLWLQGAACTGCSVSFLNRISNTAPQTAKDVLITSINLAYHPNLMASAGETAAAVAEQAYAQGGYVLAVEGGVPTAFNGNTCWPWTLNGQDVTFLSAVRRLAGRAAAVLSVGTCAGWGGMAAAAPNPTGVQGVQAATGVRTINIAGCPPHPDWIVWTIAQLLTGERISLDGSGRPLALFRRSVHEQCPRRGTDQAKTYGVDGRCLKGLGCRGPETRANCPLHGWNGAVNWCVDANGSCIGCTDSAFPRNPLRRSADV